MKSNFYCPHCHSTLRVNCTMLIDTYDKGDKRYQKRIRTLACDKCGMQATQTINSETVFNYTKDN